MKERIACMRGQIGDGFENLFALTRQACGDFGG